MREYEFELTIVAVVLVRTENESQAREAVASSSRVGREESFAALG